jgi:hypothetical protein
LVGRFGGFLRWGGLIGIVVWVRELRGRRVKFEGKSKENRRS